jgi:hypothetical protein
MIPACRVVVSGPLEIRVSIGSYYLRLSLVEAASFSFLFIKFPSLSLTAIRVQPPHAETQKRYDRACKAFLP